MHHHTILRDEVHHLCGIVDDGSPFEVYDYTSQLEYATNTTMFDFFRGRSFFWRTYCREEYLAYTSDHMMTSFQFKWEPFNHEYDVQEYEYDVVIVVPPFTHAQRCAIQFAPTDALREVARLAAMRDLFNLQSNNDQSIEYHDDYIIAGMLIGFYSLNNLHFPFCLFHPEFSGGELAVEPFEGDNVVYAIAPEGETDDDADPFRYDHGGYDLVRTSDDEDGDDDGANDDDSAMIVVNNMGRPRFGGPNFMLDVVHSSDEDLFTSDYTDDDSDEDVLADSE